MLVVAGYNIAFAGGITSADCSLAADNTKVQKNRPRLVSLGDICDGNPGFEIRADDQFNGFPLRSILLSVEKDEKLEFFAPLAMPEEGKLTTFCIPRELTSDAYLVVQYEERGCLRKGITFSQKGFYGLQIGEVTEMPLDEGEGNNK